jgi:hypothetical protein
LGTHNALYYYGMPVSPAASSVAADAMRGVTAHGGPVWLRCIAKANKQEAAPASASGPSSRAVAGSSCPECGERLFRAEGCSLCRCCGFSPCG